MPEVKVKVEGFYDIIVSVNIEDKEAFAHDEFESGFTGSGHVDESGKLWSNTNDITTNYLEVAMVKAFQHLGIKVEDLKPYPMNRKIEVVK